MSGQFFPVDPFKGRTAERVRLAGAQLTEKEIQANRFLRISVRHPVEQIPDADLDAKFLAQFARETLLKGLARFALAARKFPQAAQVIAGMPLGDEQLTGAEN